MPKRYIIIIILLIALAIFFIATPETANDESPTHIEQETLIS